MLRNIARNITIFVVRYRHWVGLSAVCGKTYCLYQVNKDDNSAEDRKIFYKIANIAEIVSFGTITLPGMIMWLFSKITALSSIKLKEINIESATKILDGVPSFMIDLFFGFDIFSGLWPKFEIATRNFRSNLVNILILSLIGQCVLGAVAGLDSAIREK